MPECRPPNFCLRSDCYRLSLFLSRSPRGCTWVCTWKSDLCIVCEFSHCRTCEDCDLNPSNSTKSKLFTWQRLKRPPDVPPPFISFPESQWLPPSCPWFHLSTPYTPFFPHHFHYHIGLLNATVSLNVFFLILVTGMKCIYMGKYICNMYACYGSNRLTRICYLCLFL